MSRSDLRQHKKEKVMTHGYGVATQISLFPCFSTISFKNYSEFTFIWYSVHRSKYKEHSEFCTLFTTPRPTENTSQDKLPTSHLVSPPSLPSLQLHHATQISAGLKNDYFCLLFVIPRPVSNIFNIYRTTNRKIAIGLITTLWQK